MRGRVFNMKKKQNKPLIITLFIVILILAIIIMVFILYLCGVLGNSSSNNPLSEPASSEFSENGEEEMNNPEESGVTSVDPEKTTKGKDDLIEKVKEIHGFYTEGVFDGYIYDFTKDGIPEVILTGTTGDDCYVLVYSEEDGIYETKEYGNLCISSLYAYGKYMISIAGGLSYPSDFDISIFEFGDSVSTIQNYKVSYETKDDGTPIVYKCGNNMSSLYENPDESKMISWSDFEKEMMEYRITPSYSDNGGGYAYTELRASEPDSVQLDYVEGLGGIIDMINRNGDMSYFKECEQLYKPILDMYYYGIVNNDLYYRVDDSATIIEKYQSYENCEGLNSTLYYSMNEGTALYNTKYGFYDINKDGTYELIISRFDYDCDAICDVYTYGDNAFVNVMEAGERWGFDIKKDGTIYESKSGGAGCSATCKYILGEGQTGLIFQEEFGYDGFYNEANPFYYTDVMHEQEDYSSYTSISENDYNAYITEQEEEESIGYYKKTFERYIINNDSAQPYDTESDLNEFYGIWVYGSKDQQEAQDFAQQVKQNGFDGQVYVSTDWSNLNQEKWYVVTAGTYYSESEAKNALDEVKLIYADAYVKYSGTRQ